MELFALWELLVGWQAGSRGLAGCRRLAGIGLQPNRCVSQPSGACQPASQPCGACLPASPLEPAYQPTRSSQRARSSQTKEIIKKIKKLKQISFNFFNYFNYFIGFTALVILKKRNKKKKNQFGGWEVWLATWAISQLWPAIS